MTEPATSRLADLIRFYEILATLENKVSSARKLAECSGRMDWPKRGVYFFFENGETRSDTGDGPRVVRVGTHALTTGSGTQLWTRLSQHRGQTNTGGGNHRGSIFRLIVGTALINKGQFGFPTWGIGNTANRVVRDGEADLERQVSEVIGNMRFLWLAIEDEPGPERRRGYLEKNSIALLSNHSKPPLDPPSPAWLGHYCNRERVRKSGLWNQNHVEESYDPAFLNELERLVTGCVSKKPSKREQFQPGQVRPTEGAKISDAPQGVLVRPVTTIKEHNTAFVIQCAASKRPDAGCSITNDGRPIHFVAHPELAPAENTCTYARPDDLAQGGFSWRTLLQKYNEQPQANSLRLLPAYQLYDNKCYRGLVNRFGVDNVYVLSAGWGLIRSDFLTPYYDITFSQSADAYKIRRKIDRYDDFRMLPNDTSGEVVFLGGKDYLPLFCKLTENIKGKRMAFFNSTDAPRFDNCEFKRFQTTTRTNWHYECAKALIDGKIDL
jgi:hypothetical protein